MFFTITSTIGPLRDSKMTFTKTGSSYDFAHNWHFYMISNPKHFFDHIHSNWTFLELSKWLSQKPEVVITLYIIDISTSFQILNMFFTIASPIGPLRASKMTFTKIGSSYNFAINRHFYLISNPSHLFEHVHTNRTFKTSKMTSAKTGSSYNFAIDWHFYVISNPKHFFDHAHANRPFQDFENDFRKNRK